MNKIKKAIILVAGLGSRLGPLTTTNPKCMIEVNGVPIMVNALNHLLEVGITEVVIVVGYLSEVIRERMGSNYKGMKITYIENPIYDKTNNMYSLWLAREHLTGDDGVLLIEGDSIFELPVLEKIMQTDEKSYWAVDDFSLFKDGCMLTADKNCSINKIQIIRGKLPKIMANQYKSADIIKIMPGLGRLFSDWLDQEVKEGNVNTYYDLILGKYLGTDMIFVCNINGLKWMEIDDYYDLRVAERIFSSDLSRPFEQKYEIVPIDILRPLEMVFPNHLENLNRLIIEDGVIKAPLLVDKETGIVLDGSHRYIVLLMNGYMKAPVHFVNYSDENIRVGTNLMHRHLIEDSTKISKKEVVERGMSGNLFRARTTRNFFPFRKINNMDLPLSALEKGETRDVAKYIEKVSIKDEIKHNEEFIKELEQEMDELVSYMYEVREVKDYLKFQLDEMRNNIN